MAYLLTGDTEITHSVSKRAFRGGILATMLLQYITLAYCTYANKVDRLLSVSKHWLGLCQLIHEY